VLGDIAEDEGGVIERPPQRRRLLEALTGVDRGIADMYEGVTRMLDDASFPDGLSLGAHAMRELMEKLPKVFDVPAGQNFSLRNRINGLQEVFERASRESDCSTADGWVGEIDRPLAELLHEVESLLADRDRDWVSRAEADRALIRRLEPGPIRRGDQLTTTEVEQWTRSRKYFEALAHHGHIYHGKRTDHVDFVDHVRGVEVLLLGKLLPATAADFAEIDTLMAAVEGSFNG
jgi:hypothetical protein